MQKNPNGTLYKIVDKKLKIFRVYCTVCNKKFSNKLLLAKHHEKCLNDINTTYKEKKMPIQKIIKNGTTYYRYGDHGDLYKTKAEAETQMRAMYAHGYKGSSKDTPKKK